MLQRLILRGKHSSDRNVAALTQLGPLAVNYCVSAPDLANLLPIGAALRVLSIEKKCKHYLPLASFKNLEALVVPESELSQVFALLGHIPTLTIADPSGASSPDRIAALRKQYSRIEPL